MKRLILAALCGGVLCGSVFAANGENENALGDQNQLKSVTAGDMVSKLQEVATTVQMNEVLRQKSTEAKSQEMKSGENENTASYINLTAGAISGGGSELSIVKMLVPDSDIFRTGVQVENSHFAHTAKAALITGVDNTDMDIVYQLGYGDFHVGRGSNAGALSSIGIERGLYYASPMNVTMFANVGSGTAINYTAEAGITVELIDVFDAAALYIKPSIREVSAGGSSRTQSQVVFGLSKTFSF